MIGVPEHLAKLGKVRRSYWMVSMNQRKIQVEPKFSGWSLYARMVFVCICKCENINIKVFMLIEELISNTVMKGR